MYTNAAKQLGTLLVWPPVLNPWPAFVLFEQIYNLQAISREADMCNLAASDAHLIDYFHRDA